MLKNHTSPPTFQRYVVKDAFYDVIYISLPSDSCGKFSNLLIIDILRYIFWYRVSADI